MIVNKLHSMGNRQHNYTIMSNAIRRYRFGCGGVVHHPTNPFLNVDADLGEVYQPKVH